MLKPAPILAVGIGIIVLILASPYGLGMLAESNIRAEIEILDEYPPLSIEVVDYERGWFSSTATISIQPAAAYAQAFAAEPSVGAIFDQIEAPFIIEMNHGPILTMDGLRLGSFAVDAQLDPATPWVQMALSTLGIPYLFEIRGHAGFGSGFDFEGGVPAFDFTESAGTLTFSGLDIKGNTNGREVSFESGIASVELQSPFMAFILEGFGVNGDYEFRPNSIALGTGEIVLEQFAASYPMLGAEPIVRLEGVGVSATSALNAADNLDIASVYRVGAVQVQSGPEISDAMIGINIANLNAAAIDQLYASMDQMYSGTTEPALLGLSLLPSFNDIIADGPTLSIDPLQFTMDGGRASGHLNLSIDPAGLPTGQVTDFMDPATAMAAVKADLELTVDKGLLRELMAMTMAQQLGPMMAELSDAEIDAMLDEQIGQMIAGTVAMGMVADNGDSYSTTIMYENGTATINGIPMPLAALGF